MADIDDKLSRLIRDARQARPDPDVETRIAARVSVAVVADLPWPSTPAPVVPTLVAKAGALVVATLVASSALWWARGQQDAAPSEAVASPPVRERLAIVAISPPPTAIPAAPTLPLSTSALPGGPPRKGARLSAVQTAPVVDPAAAEWTLVRQAEEAAPHDPAAALRLVDAHAHRFPDGALVQEREVIAVDALIRLGRESEGRHRAERLLKRYPRTVHRAHVEALLAGSVGERPRGY